MGTDPCLNSTCKKKRGKARNPQVTKVSAPAADCPKLTNAQALAEIQADVIDEYSFDAYEITKCSLPNCVCGITDSSWPKEEWETQKFEWELEKTIPAQGAKKAHTCTYQIEGTVETCVQLAEGPCKAFKLKKGKTPKKKAKAGKKPVG
jgi:hypothetical protein